MMFPFYMGFGFSAGVVARGTASPRHPTATGATLAVVAARAGRPTLRPMRRRTPEASGIDAKCRNNAGGDNRADGLPGVADVTLVAVEPL